MRVHILASGSTGNSAVIDLGGHRFLVDAGISCKNIEIALSQCGYRGTDLSGILVTHEHSDHIKGMDVLVRKYCLPVFAREKTWQRIPCRTKLPPACVRTIEQSITIGKVKIEAFNISHDAVDPVGFVFYSKTRKCVLVTDFGISNANIEDALCGADIAVVESNHDMDMLANGPYPPYLKARIRSPRGHHSNHDTGLLLGKVTNSKKPLHVFLAHLSQENNRPAVAEQSVSYVLDQSGAAVGKDIILHKTHPHQKSSLILE